MPSQNSCGKSAALTGCVRACVCVYHMQKLLDIRLITETLISPLLLPSSLISTFASFSQLKVT